MSRSWPWLLLIPAVLFVLWRGLRPGPDAEIVARRLQEHHATLLRAHLEDDLDAWMDLEAEDYVEVARGEIRRPSRVEREARRRRWLDATEFSRYEDLVEPEVHVSPGGDAGWVLCQVRVEGAHEQDGETSSIEAVWAWIELYERRDGMMKLVGNVSTQRP
jgi:hypothetical protein